LSHKLQVARRAARTPKLPLLSAEARAAAARAALSSIETRIAADRAQYGETAGAEVPALTRAASRSERDAAMKRAEADVLTQERALPAAETNTDADTRIATERST